MMSGPRLPQYVNQLVRELVGILPSVEWPGRPLSKKIARNRIECNVITEITKAIATVIAVIVVDLGRLPGLTTVDGSPRSGEDPTGRRATDTGGATRRTGVKRTIAGIKEVVGSVAGDIGLSIMGTHISTWLLT